MRQKRPSAPMVLSIIALVLSLAGTGAASVATISALSKQEKKQTRKIAKKQIRKAAPGLSVAKAANADKLGGQPASSFAPATTLRTVTIAADGTVIAAQSDGVSQGNVTRITAGFYCFNGLSPAPRSVVASISDGGAASSVRTESRVSPSVGSCAGSQIDVATIDSGNSLVPRAFTVFIH